MNAPLKIPTAGQFFSSFWPNLDLGVVTYQTPTGGVIPFDQAHFSDFYVLHDQMRSYGRLLVANQLDAFVTSRSGSEYEARDGVQAFFPTSSASEEEQWHLHYLFEDRLAVETTAGRFFTSVRNIDLGVVDGTNSFNVDTRYSKNGYSLSLGTDFAPLKGQPEDNDYLSGPTLIWPTFSLNHFFGLSDAATQLDEIIAVAAFICIASKQLEWERATKFALVYPESPTMHEANRTAIAKAGKLPAGLSDFFGEDYAYALTPKGAEFVPLPGIELPKLDSSNNGVEFVVVKWRSEDGSFKVLSDEIPDGPMSISSKDGKTSVSLTRFSGPIMKVTPGVQRLWGAIEKAMGIYPWAIASHGV